MKVKIETMINKIHTNMTSQNNILNEAEEYAGMH